MWKRNRGHLQCAWVAHFWERVMLALPTCTVEHTWCSGVWVGCCVSAVPGWLGLMPLNKKNHKGPYTWLLDDLLKGVHVGFMQHLKHVHAAHAQFQVLTDIA